ncbi:MAG: 1-acyl-sn-glycerol-3-phosphate acyltransferase [Chloroflexi bacterium]|nr:1-acyl-sn-glycerol-3-phosphate acyltransferase [Chloroflexota bacterium]
MSWQVKLPSPPPGYRYGPRYGPSRENILRGIVYILRGKSRSLARDALLVITNMPLPPRIRCADRIPERGPFVVVANHYERPGLWMVWPAMLVAHLVRERTGQDTHWIAIEQWESFRLLSVSVPPALIRRVFERTFRTYGIMAMASPDAPAAARAGSMRRAVQAIRDGEIVGLMPEGDVGPTPELLEAKEGVGAFLLMLAGRGAPVVPIGLYEEDGRLVAHAGPPLDLAPPPGLPRDQREGWARTRVMLALRELLPEPLWGAYRETEKGTVADR